jgi:enoyl-[acyl-carrier protein] reductase II
LGADGVQIGSRFAISEESSAHVNFKKKVAASEEGETILTLKELTPVRLIKNKFYEEVKTAQQRGASAEELKALLGKGRAKKGIFEGDLDEGELEIGQISAAIKDIRPAAEILKGMWEEYLDLRKNFYA